MTSTHPDVILQHGESAPANSGGVATAQNFVTGQFAKGPVGSPILVRSAGELAARIGPRDSSNPTSYDSVETLLREGASSAYLSRVVGPDAVKATCSIYDQAGSTSGDVALTATAREYGDYYNGYGVNVIAGSGENFQIQVTDGTNILETSGDLATRADAVTWSTGSAYVTLTLGASNENPRVQTASLASGDDDAANATDTQWAAALAVFPKEMGAGQVYAFGRTTDQAHEDLDAHAAAMNRRAMCDTPDTGVVATLAAVPAVLRALDDDGRYAPVWGGYAIAPGVVPNTSRRVPLSAVAGGIISRNDNAGVSPNRASAGATYGVAQWVTSLANGTFTDGVQWSDDDLDTLHQAGVNVARILTLGGRPTIMGYRTPADEDSAPQYVDFAGMRMLMSVDAQIQTILAAHEFDEIDGQGVLFSIIKGEVVGILTPLWKAGHLYGATADEAFTVDTGPSVNTAETIAAREVHVQYAIKTSPTTERLIATSVKTQIGA